MLGTAQSMTICSPLFELDAEHVLTAEDIVEAWHDTVPDLASRVLDLRVGASTVIFDNPKIVVRRIR